MHLDDRALLHRAHGDRDRRARWRVLRGVGEEFGEEVDEGLGERGAHGGGRIARHLDAAVGDDAARGGARDIHEAQRLPPLLPRPLPAQHLQALRVPRLLCRRVVGEHRRLQKLRVVRVPVGEARHRRLDAVRRTLHPPRQLHQDEPAGLLQVLALLGHLAQDPLEEVRDGLRQLRALRTRRGHRPAPHRRGQPLLDEVLQLLAHQLRLLRQVRLPVGVPALGLGRAPGQLQGEQLAIGDRRAVLSAQRLKAAQREHHQRAEQDRGREPLRGQQRDRAAVAAQQREQRRRPQHAGRATGRRGRRDGARRRDGGTRHRTPSGDVRKKGRTWAPRGTGRRAGAGTYGRTGRQRAGARGPFGGRAPRRPGEHIARTAVSRVIRAPAGRGGRKSSGASCA